MTGKFRICASLYADCKVQLHYEREVRPLGTSDIMHRISFKMWHTIVLVAQDVLILSTHTHTHTQPFYGPFSRATHVIQCQRISGLYGAREE